MKHRWWYGAVVLTSVWLASPPARIAGQAPGTRPEGTRQGEANSQVSRTPDGRPQLQGTWTYATITPLERPAELADKPFLTEKEAAEYEKQLIAAGNKDVRGGDGQSDISAAYNDFWWDRGTSIVGTRRTSLIIDPPNGRIPPLTAEGRQRAARAAERRARSAADGPEDRNLAERCLVSLNAGPPILPSAYNNNFQLFQTPTLIAIFNEMIHDTRFIPLDGRPSLNPRVRQWMGTSRGRWEGDTLLVETTNFRPDSAPRGASEDVRIVERFTRVGPDVLMYEFTMIDPRTWVQPWTAQIPMSRTADKLYEYACHEGNLAMTNMLAGARAEEARTKK